MWSNMERGNQSNRHTSRRATSKSKRRAPAPAQLRVCVVIAKGMHNRWYLHIARTMWSVMPGLQDVVSHSYPSNRSRNTKCREVTPPDPRFAGPDPVRTSLDMVGRPFPLISVVVLLSGGFTLEASVIAGHATQLHRPDNRHGLPGSAQSVTRKTRLDWRTNQTMNTVGACLAYCLIAAWLSLLAYALRGIPA
jgi:hypothetical protein